MNIGDVLSQVLTYAPAAANVYAGAQKGRMEGQELKRKREVEAAEASRKEAEDAARLEYLHAQAAALKAKTEAPPKAPTIKVGGREFPDTPEGQAAAAEWDKRLHPSKYREPAPPAPHAPVMGSPEYLAALDAIETVRDKHRTPSPPPRNPRREELRNGLIKRYGAPSSQARQDALDELVKGKDRIQILSEMKAKGVPAAIINDVGDYLTPDF